MNFCRSFLFHRNYISSACRYYSSNFQPPPIREYAIVHKSNNPKALQAITWMKDFHPNLEVIQSNDTRLHKNVLYWYLARGKFILDSFYFPIDYLTEDPLEWSEYIDDRRQNRFDLSRNSAKCSYKAELNAAADIVTRCSFLSRSYQALLVHDKVAPIKKMDNTPVTLLDYAIQAIIIERLSTLFPHDKFIAEEDSNFLRSDPHFTEEVLYYVKLATGNSNWSREKLFHYIDLGAHSFSDKCNSEDMKAQRCWAIDPIDGTKGFIKGLHYCVGLVLLEKGTPVLSMMGCPNLNVFRVLSKKGDISMIDIANNVEIEESFNSQNDHLLARQALGEASTTLNSLPYFPIFNSGSLYYAISGEGAFARSFTMPLHESFPVQVSNVTKLGESTLCEASETSRHDHLFTRSLAVMMKLRTLDYIRLHSMVKYCIVGCGGAEGTIRYPPRNYVEKIWDHIPGAHFVKEAGGKTTDFHGFDLECHSGKTLDEKVRGIVVSNGKIHQKLLYAVQTALQP
jgi:3'-phosphoadenosine 5'-phosphosulfate (PAPS) 3'-phosphatase